MSDRTPVIMLDPAGATDGQVPTYDAAAGRVVWAAPLASGGVTANGGEALMVDGVAPPENVTTEAGDDWLYEG